MKDFGYRLEYFFFPWDAHCLLCKNEHVEKYGLCKDCLRELEAPDGDRCKICLDRTDTEGLCGECFALPPDYECLFSPFVFDGVLRELLHDFKFNNKRYLRYPLAQMLLDAIPQNILSECDIFIPVPMSTDRLRERGYNQTELLVRELTRLTDIPCINDALKKLPGQKHMSLLNKAERRKNIKGFYYCDKKLCGETVLLVDDICTTGETLRTCAQELKKANAGKIYCVTVARTDLKTK